MEISSNILSKIAGFEHDASTLILASKLPAFKFTLHCTLVPRHASDVFEALRDFQPLPRLHWHFGLANEVEEEEREKRQAGRNQALQELKMICVALFEELSGVEGCALPTDLLQLLTCLNI